MNKHFWGVFSFLFAVSIIVGFAGGTVFAQGSSIGINPAYPDPENPRSSAIFIHTIDPGGDASDGVMVINNTNEKRTVDLGVVDSATSVDGSFSCKQNKEKQTKVGTWIQLAKTSVVLEPGTNEIVNFTIKVPKSAGPGEHGGCVTAQDKESYAPEQGSGILLGFRSAIRIAVTVPGDIIKKLDIVKVETKRLPDGNYSVSTVAKNSGNVSLDVQERAQLVSLLGQKTAVKDDAKYPIIAGATTAWPYTFDRPFWGGLYKARVSLSYNANPNDGIGENVDAVQKISATSKYFFTVPAPQAIAIYVALIGLIIVVPLWRYRTKRLGQKLKGSWRAYTVQAGDTLTLLADERGVSWKKLAKVNHIDAPYAVKPGQPLLLPGRKQSSSARDRRVSRASLDPRHKEGEEGARLPSGNGMTASDNVRNIGGRSLENKQGWLVEDDVTAKLKHKKLTEGEHKSVSATRLPDANDTLKSQKTTGRYAWANPSSPWAPVVPAEPDLDSGVKKVQGDNNDTYRTKQQKRAPKDGEKKKN